MQHDPMDPNFNDEALEPDGWMWVRGVDYVAGWRSAVDAATELKGAMDEAGIDTTEVMSTASTTTDGSGVLRLSLPVQAALALANAAREDALRWRKAGA
ncbi:hypothetical protein CP981_24740 [Streptomyces platensis]|uniref:Uncharacterized protein n=1 Tax=Streptomyces platensis TaxID=58346 RepID=A0AAE6NKR5_STRPT|nr:hypothetical protein [Streptomyces platensis]OSY45581.1 hypothetical protein BG653_02871 [Streptomyces platensis]QEV54403.1 hypothetical protein CP981_24740 [Streptomyces platensis]